MAPGPSSKYKQASAPPPTKINGCQHRTAQRRPFLRDKYHIGHEINSLDIAQSQSCSADSGLVPLRTACQRSVGHAELRTTRFLSWFLVGEFIKLREVSGVLGARGNGEAWECIVLAYQDLLACLRQGQSRCFLVPDG
jgi:hypothetical protein